MELSLSDMMNIIIMGATLAWMIERPWSLIVLTLVACIYYFYGQKVKSLLIVEFKTVAIKTFALVNTFMKQRQSADVTMNVSNQHVCYSFKIDGEHIEIHLPQKRSLLGWSYYGNNDGERTKLSHPSCVPFMCTSSQLGYQKLERSKDGISFEEL